MTIGIGGRILMRSLGEAVWNDISGASYDSKSFDLSTQNSAPRQSFFKSDGTKFYSCDYGNDTVYQYSLSTAWDISTASYDSKSFDVSLQDTGLLAIFFKPDGTKFYAAGGTNDTIFQYSLSTAWDISTASYDSKSFDVGSQIPSPVGLFFKPDGTKFYSCDYGNDTVYQYSLSTAWDISTASYDSKSFDVGSQESSLLEVVFKPDGTKFYVMGRSLDTIFQYSLSTAWDISTASYDSKSFDVGSQEDNPAGLFFKPDGTKFYISGYGSDTVYQYSL